MVTYENQSPADIRIGDVVTDSFGRTFIAFSDSVLEMGDYQVLGIDGNGNEKWFAIDPNSLVAISYDESMWTEDTYA